jgi:hypothetical protein
MTPRWEGDERGRGIADASGRAADVAAFADRMRDSGWVAEDPEAHLAHHLVRACAMAPSELSLLEMREDDGELVVSVRLREPGTFQDTRGAVMRLVGHVSEGSTFVRERRSEDALEFEVATGMTPGEGGFTGHGHTLRILVQDAQR